WVANLGILFVLIAQARNSHDNLKRKLIPAVGIAAILGIAGLICYCSFDGQNGFAWYYERLLPAQRELFVLKDDKLLRLLFNDTRELRRLVGFLKEHHLSIFR